MLQITVNNDAKPIGLRMLLGHTLHECAGEVKVVVGNNGDDGGGVQGWLF